MPRFPRRPVEELLDPTTPVFGLLARQIGRRVQATARGVALGEGFTSHSAAWAWPRTW